MNSTVLRVARALPLVLLMSAIGCSDATGPCGDDASCAAPTINLALERIALVSWSGNSVDEATGKPIVLPGNEVTIEYLVRNRGLAYSAAASVSVCAEHSDTTAANPVCRYTRLAADTIIPLAPGDSVIGTLTGSIDGWPFRNDSTLSLLGTLSAVAADEVPEDDVARIDGLLIGGVRLSMHLEAPARSYIGDSIQFVLRIENASRLTSVPADTLRYCMADYDAVFCENRRGDIWERAVHAFAGLGPRQVSVDTARVWLEPAFMGGSEDLPWDARVWAACLDGAVRCVTSGSLVAVYPNLDLACGAALIAPDTPLSGTTDQDCDLWNADDNAVFSFDAPAGARFRAQLTTFSDDRARIAIINHDGDRIVEYDGVAVEFTAPAADHYHVLVAEAGTFTLVLTPL